MDHSASLTITAAAAAAAAGVNGQVPNGHHLNTKYFFLLFIINNSIYTLTSFQMLLMFDGPAQTLYLG